MNDYVTVLGVGNILYSDDGAGVRVVEKLKKKYVFLDNVTLVDGGVLNMNLMGIISDADRLIVVDTVLNGCGSFATCLTRAGGYDILFIGLRR